MPIIDFHTHIFPPEILARRDAYLERDGWFHLLYSNPQAKMASADHLIAEMNASRVDMAVTFGFAWADPGLCREANDYVLDSVSRWPDRLLGFAVVNPTRQNAAAELERCLQKGLCGLGELMPEGQGYTL
ncbi:MAG: amidohydrolase family protein, partial [Anaerolineae bacterium]